MKIPWKDLYWPTTIFFIITPIVAFVFVPLYFIKEGFPLGILLMALIFAGLTNLSITAGYHRLFSHRSYDAHWLVRLAFLLIGASAWQGSALKWSSDHRRHHEKVDTDEDPYNISKGFWHAHMGWLFLKTTVDKAIKAPDLQKDWMIRNQDKYYIPLALFMSFGVPTWIGYLMGAPWAGFLIGGVLRVLLTQQSTFFVNSLSHTLGSQPYSHDSSARDSILVAVLTHGEGYHNFHHQFQFDYRNGIRWYHWDPTKWTIWLLKALGLAKKLRKISEQEILRARLNMEELKMKSRGFSEAKLEQLRSQILEAQIRLTKMKNEYKVMKSSMGKASREHLERMKTEMELLSVQLSSGLKQWQRLLSSPVPI